MALKETIRMVCLSKIDGDVEMNAMLAAYTALGAAIILEVSGSTLLKLSQQFTKLWPSLGCWSALSCPFTVFLLR